MSGRDSDLNKQLLKRAQIENIILDIVRTKNPQTTEQLIRIAQVETGLPEQEIAAIIIRLQNEDKLQFSVAENFAFSDSEFVVFSRNTAWFWVTVVISIASAAAVFLIPADLNLSGYVRQFLGSVFVLFLPGYAFIKMVFPCRVPYETGSENLDNIERLVLSIGMSLTIAPVVGLILYYTPLGLGLPATTLSLLVLTLFLGFAALAREYQIPVRGPPIPPPPPPPSDSSFSG